MPTFRVRLFSRGRTGMCTERCVDHQDPCAECEVESRISLHADGAEGVNLDRWLASHDADLFMTLEPAAQDCHSEGTEESAVSPSACSASSAVPKDGES